MPLLREALDEVALTRSIAHPSSRRGPREHAGITQQALAGVLGISRAAVSRYEAGTRTPRGARLVAYSEALAVLQAAAPANLSREPGDLAAIPRDVG